MTMVVSAGKRMNRSLVLASLELGRSLADRDGTVFRVKGRCMYPTVRAGDVLRIQSRSAVDVSVGDIAVCRRPGYMIGHRVISKGEKEGRTYIITRPDNTLDGNDGPTFDEDLLGVVVTIERRGTIVPQQPGSYSWLVRAFFSLRLEVLTALSQAHAWLAGLLAKVQDSMVYRYIARGLLMVSNPRISYSVRLPMPVLGDAVYRQMAVEAFDLRKDWRGRPVKRWSLIMHVNDDSRPAAWATFAHDAANSWHTSESFIRPRFRGTGLEEKLEREAAAIILRETGTRGNDEG
jgi:signal peptidase I